MSSPELGETFYNTNLRVQTRKCNSIIDDVTEQVLEEGLRGDKLDLVGEIEREIETMERNTKSLFDNPDRINDLNRHLRRILLNIAEDFGYKQKLYDKNNNLQDDISTLFYWFELVAKPNLSSDYHEVSHSYAIHQCRQKRNDSEHGESGARIRPDIIGIGILTWYALHEILLNWKRAQRQVIHGHLNRIEQDDEHNYGFICKLNNQEGSGVPNALTDYEAGESGNNIAFDPDCVTSFPAEGDVVVFSKSEENGNTTADEISVL